VPAHPAVAGSWLTDSRRRTAVAIAFNLVPFYLFAVPVLSVATAAELVTAASILVNHPACRWERRHPPRMV